MAEVASGPLVYFIYLFKKPGAFSKMAELGGKL